MARPERNTVDYFPHMLGEGKKMFYIEQKYGNDGYACWYKILEKLGTTENHYLNLNKEEEVMYLAAKCRVTDAVLLSIISDLSKMGVFDKELWESKVVWCQQFTDSIEDAYKRRNNKCITFEGLCIQLRSLGILKLGKRNLKVDKNTQSRVEYSKEEETKEEEKASPTITSLEIIKNNFGLEIKKFVDNPYPREMLLDFFEYWVEPNQLKTKLKFQLQKTWDLERRLKTWNKNEQKFNNGKQTGINQRHAPAFSVGTAAINSLEELERNNLAGGSGGTIFDPG